MWDCQRITSTVKTIYMVIWAMWDYLLWWWDSNLREQKPYIFVSPNHCPISMPLSHHWSSTSELAIFDDTYFRTRPSQFLLISIVIPSRGRTCSILYWNNETLWKYDTMAFIVNPYFPNIFSSSLSYPIVLMTINPVSISSSSHAIFHQPSSCGGTPMTMETRKPLFTIIDQH